MYSSLSNPKVKSGFTLVELSIVLVIIGLIVGGVLIGRDLINAAQLRGLITEREKLLTSVNAFRLKYNGLPGDLSGAENFWGTDPGGCPNTAYNTDKKATTCNGNGNGIIEGFLTPSTCVYPNIGANREVHRFWQHLSNAGLIDESFTGATGGLVYYAQTLGINAPRSRHGSAVGISIGGSVNATCAPTDAYFQAYYSTLFYVGKQLEDDVTEMPFLTPLDAFSIDSKIDDGKPGIGRVMVFAPGVAFPVNVNCADSSTAASAVYLMTQTGQNCTLLYNERL